MHDHINHHGVKGQKWGVRRYQNEDGSLTPAGQKKQRKDERKDDRKKLHKELRKENKSLAKHFLLSNSPTSMLKRERNIRRASKYVTENNLSVKDAMKRSNKVSRQKTALFVAGVSAVTIGSFMLKKHNIKL